MAPQLQINQGPQDALLFDNTRSYFTNVGYVRTSNFQMELRDVDPQNTAALGGTVNFVIPKAADLLGPVDLMLEFEQATNTPGTGNVVGWVESLGLAMIEKLTFSVGSHDVEVLTGDHMNIMNELMRGDSQRYGFEHTLKTGRPLAVGQIASTNMSYLADDDSSSDCHDRIIGIDSKAKDGKKLIVPLGLFFTTHPSKYFPLAAIAGSNDIRISIKFRTLQELVQLKGYGAVSGSALTETTALAQPTMPTYTNGALKASSCKLRCHYIHVTGPEATQLMNREHVRLMKHWYGNEVSKQFSISCGPTGVAKTLDIDLSFLHPVQELIITIRKVSDMGSSVASNVAPGAGPRPATNVAFGKNYFAYHGGGKRDPNPDSLTNSFEGNVGGVNGGTFLKTKSLTLRLNGQTRHLDGQGIDRDYLMHRLMPMLHSNTTSTFSKVAETSIAKGAAAEADAASTFGYAHDLKMLKELVDRKEIYVYPFALNPEGANPSGSVNFSKVSHAKLSIAVDGFTDLTGTAGATGAVDEDFQVDVYGIFYNWLAIKEGRALTSFA